jgi:hypothetical protein
VVFWCFEWCLRGRTSGTVAAVDRYRNGGWWSVDSRDVR